MLVEELGGGAEGAALGVAQPDAEHELVGGAEDRQRIAREGERRRVDDHAGRVLSHAR